MEGESRQRPAWRRASSDFPLTAAETAKRGSAVSQGSTASVAFSLDEPPKEPAAMKKTLDAPRHGQKKEAIVVGVRLRPLVRTELGQEHVVKIRSPNVATIMGDAVGEPLKQFAFDFAMDSTDPSDPNYVSQEKCYVLIGKRMLDHIVQGFNTCLFCYGQTGTGKTTTIMGNVIPEPQGQAKSSTGPRHDGLLLRLFSDIFDHVNQKRAEGLEVVVQLMMLEIYNEKLNDLLLPKGSFGHGGHGDIRRDKTMAWLPDVDDAPGYAGTSSGGPKKKTVEIHVHPEMGAYVTGATDSHVETFEDCLSLVNYGNSMKTVHATEMNATSSRGHTVVRLSLKQSGFADHRESRSEVFFADLAGRENERTTKVSGDRLIELTFINKSLFCLSQCIQALGSGEDSMARRKSVVAAPRDHGQRKSVANVNGDERQDSRRKTITGLSIPEAKTSGMSMFRNSKLTLLLSKALSGNARTAMIGTLSPALANYDESKSTLMFASTVKKIQLEATAATKVDKQKLVASLQAEIAELKRQLAAKADAHEKTGNRDIKRRLEDAEAIAEQESVPIGDIRRQSQIDADLRKRTQEKFGIARCGLGSNAQYPNLSNLCSDDPARIATVTFFIPRDDRTHKIGSDDKNEHVLEGPGVAREHAEIRNVGGTLKLRAVEQLSGPRFPTVQLNGAQISREEADGRPHWEDLKQFDRILFGQSAEFIVLLRPTSFEELQQHVQQSELSSSSDSDAEDGETLPEAEVDKILEGILGRDAADPVQMALARHRYKELQGQYDRELASGMGPPIPLHTWLRDASDAQAEVQEANAITQRVRPHEGLLFELVGQAPLLSCGFTELGVRLLRNEPGRSPRPSPSSPSSARGITLDGSVCSTPPHLRRPSSGSMVREGKSQRMTVVLSWTMDKFKTRLALMREVDQRFAQGPERFFKIDAWNDPWAEYAPTELAPFRRNQHGLTPAHCEDELRRVQEELRAAKEELSLLRNGQSVPLGVPAATGRGAMLVSGSGPNVCAQITNCLELADSSQALLERLLNLQTQPKSPG